MKWVVALAILLALGSASWAFLATGVIVSGNSGGSPIPPSCDTSLDFSEACNSQYLAIGGMF